MDKETAIARLNDFVREENSAVTVYKQAISIMPNTGTRRLLEELQVAHAGRVMALKQRIGELGGDADTTRGLWSTLPQAAREGSEDVALTVLEENENEGLRNYQSRLELLDNGSKQLVLRELLPGQEVTRTAVSQLRARMSA